MIVNPVMYSGGSKSQFQVKITGTPDNSNSVTIDNTKYTAAATVTANKNTAITVEVGSMMSSTRTITFNGITVVSAKSARSAEYIFPLITDCEINVASATAAITSE